VLRTIASRSKRWLRRPYRRARSKYIRWRYGFGRAELLSALQRAGVCRGDVALVHSSFGEFEAFDGGAPDIVTVLEDALGPEGTLLMPTLSMSGSAIEFAASGRIFDPRTTPSQVGLLTEVFRRMPGVARSVHPTHSVAARGRDAEWCLKDHHLADTPCGRGTPFHRLLERNGKVVLAGVGIGAMTFFHCAEELLEDRMPFSPFTAERFVLRCRVGGKTIETASMRLYAPDVSRRRQLGPLEAELRLKGRWRESRVGTLNLIALEAAVLLTLEEMARRGEFCYKPE
jgi:aminoglycoside 3-N-acetyltransferase